MAGLPPEVVARASQILKNLEANEIDVNAKEKAVRRPRKRLSDLPGQMTFFSLLAALSLVFQCGAATTIHRSFRNRDTGYVNGATPGFSAPSARNSTGASSAPKAVRGKAPNKLEGRLGQVVDGGLVSIVDGSGNAHAVSLRHIDAPAADQPFGPEAAKFLGDLLRGKEIEVLWTKKDASGAISGDVYYRHEKFGMVDANMTMVKNGAAWQAYRDTDKTYAAAEKEARAAKRGLWAAPKPVRPSEWRKRRK